MPFLWLVVVVVCNVIVVDSNELNLQCKCCHINIRGERKQNGIHLQNRYQNFKSHFVLNFLRFLFFVTTSGDEATEV